MGAPIMLNPSKIRVGGCRRRWKPVAPLFCRNLSEVVGLQSTEKKAQWCWMHRLSMRVHGVLHGHVAKAPATRPRPPSRTTGEQAAPRECAAVGRPQEARKAPTVAVPGRADAAPT